MTSTTRPARESGNIRNGTRAKTVLTEATGQVEIEVPRDRAGTFEPQIVQEAAAAAVRGRRDRAVAVCQGPDHRGDHAHFAEIYGASVSQGDRSRRITDKVIEEMTRLVAPAAGRGLRGGVHRRDHGQGPRRAGRATGRSTPRSGSTWTGRRTSSGCGPAPAVRARSSG